MITASFRFSIYDIRTAVQAAFEHFEKQDEIVGSVYLSPRLMKKVVLSIPDEIIFAFIPEGIGMMRTAHIYFGPNVEEHEMRFYNQNKDMMLRLFLD